MTFTQGDVVEWTPIVGGVMRGVVSRLKLGRVYVRYSFSGRRGRRVSRTVECVFESHEIDRLRKVAP